MWEKKKVDRSPLNVFDFDIVGHAKSLQSLNELVGVTGRCHDIGVAVQSGLRPEVERLRGLLQLGQDVELVLVLGQHAENLVTAHQTTNG